MARGRRRNIHAFVVGVLCGAVVYIFMNVGHHYVPVRTTPSVIERQSRDFNDSFVNGPDDREVSVPVMIEAADDDDVDIGTHKLLPGFIISSTSACAGQIDLLVYIQSYWGNFMKRRVIRNTWAGKRSFHDINIRSVFILGKPDDAADQVKINSEQLLHRDIIEGNFTDSYHNLTIKSIVAVKWIFRYCKNTKFVLKSDDDIFVNVFSVLERVTATMDYRRNIVACHVKEEGTSVIVRDKNSKWYIPETVFPNRTTLPRFCSGYAVVMSIKSVRSLYKASLHSPLIYVDDVYLFGQLTKDIPDISFIDLSRNLTLSQDIGLASYRKSNMSDLVAVGAGQSWVMEELWSLALLKMSSWAKRHSVFTKSRR